MIQSIAARDGETFGLAFARNRVDDNPAATAVGVDFDLPLWTLKWHRGKSAVGRCGVNKSVFSQGCKPDAEAMILVIIRAVFLTRGVVKIGAAVIHAHLVFQKQRLSGGRDHAAVPAIRPERD